jgi:hypothetical protein
LRQEYVCELGENGLCSRRGVLDLVAQQCEDGFDTA